MAASAKALHNVSMVAVLAANGTADDFRAYPSNQIYAGAAAKMRSISQRQGLGRWQGGDHFVIMKAA